MQLLFNEKLDDQSIADVFSGEAVLWLGTDLGNDDDSTVAICGALVAPWRAILAESSESKLAAEVHRCESRPQDGVAQANLYVISTDPTNSVFPQSFKPFFFLNGEKSTGELAGSARASLRRRLNMLAKVQELEPKRVYVVSNSPLEIIKDFVESWASGLRASITIVTDSVESASSIEDLLSANTGLVSVVWLKRSTIEFLSIVGTRSGALVDTGAAAARIRLPSGADIEVDLAPANLSDQPLFDAVELILSRDLLPVAPSDLREAEFNAFFTTQASTWRPYAAGLPWVPDVAPEHTLLAALAAAHKGPSEENSVCSVVSEPGAGGTTQALTLAFAAAKAGYPTLIVKPHSILPSGLAITNFLYRALSQIEQVARRQSIRDRDIEPAWLLVLDVEHLQRGYDDLWRLFAELSRSGRRYVLLTVIPSDSPLEPPIGVKHTELIYVNHELDEATIANLGKHLNVFLKLYGKEKSVSQWQSFSNAHKPDIDTSLASFWIALEFWLAGQLELGESIQQWVLREFRNLDAARDVKIAILEIAALSIERRALPERLLQLLDKPNLPWSYVLDEARRSKPCLGLQSGRSTPFGRVWAVAHDVLARHLLSAVWADRELDDSLQLGKTQDGVDFRLKLIQQVTVRPQMGENFARPLAISLATSVLKVDERGGNPEFFRHWRTVLAILDAVPLSVRNTSRTFNHHIAISRRRIARAEIFQATPQEKLELLLEAKNRVSFALESISGTAEDESDLNLYNTLALVFQDLAILERETTNNKDKIAEYLDKSNIATQKALKENSSNSYVLETAAKQLLRRSPELDESARVKAAAEALSYIFRASALDAAAKRSASLGNLANEALKLLRTPLAQHAVDALCTQGVAYGFIARAWLTLADSEVAGGKIIEGSVSSQSAEAAIATLRSAPTRHWLLAQMEYQLVALAQPLAFDQQLRLLDELDSFSGIRLSLQERLERAVLLYQEGRHVQAAKEFGRLRVDIKASDAILAVPERLRWLLTPDRRSRARCNATAIDSATGRVIASVSELSKAVAPLNAQEFAHSRLTPGQRLKVWVTFSAMGPFLKPAEASRH